MPTAQVVPGAARRAPGLEDVLGRAAVVGGLQHVERHFRVHDHAHAGMLLAHGLDLLDREPHVHRAVALPQNQARAIQLVFRHSRRTARTDPTRPSRPAARPSSTRYCVRDADRAGTESFPSAATPIRSVPAAFDEVQMVPPTLADERLDGRCGVDVGHRHHAGGDAHLLELRPAGLQLIGRDHVGHRAARPPGRAESPADAAAPGCRRSRP